MREHKGERERARESERERERARERERERERESERERERARESERERERCIYCVDDRVSRNCRKEEMRIRLGIVWGVF